MLLLLSCGAFLGFNELREIETKFSEEIKIVSTY